MNPTLPRLWHPALLLALMAASFADGVTGCISAALSSSLPGCKRELLPWGGVNLTLQATAQEATAQEAPPPLFSDRTHEQVEQFLANAPPGADEGPIPGLRVYKVTQLSVSHHLAALLASVAALCLTAPGLWMLYQSLTGERLGQAETGRLVSLACLLVLVWIMLFYSLAFARNAHSYDLLEKELHVIDRETAPGSIFIGDLHHTAFNDLLPSWAGGENFFPLRRLGSPVTHVAFMLFQTALFVQALIPVMFVARRQFGTVALGAFCLLWSGLVFVPLSYWTQGGGWLAECVDAGSAVPLHIATGFTVLGLSLGRPRIGLASAAPVNLDSTTLPPHTAEPSQLFERSNTVEDWFAASSPGRAAGASLHAALAIFAGSMIVGTCRPMFTGAWSAVAMLNLLLASAAGLLCWNWLGRHHTERPESAWPLGLLPGLLAVSPGATSLPPTLAILVSFVATYACHCLLTPRSGTSIDLAKLLVVLHGVSAALGMVLTGLFASPDMAGRDSSGKPIIGLLNGEPELIRVQLLTVGVAVALSCLATLVLARGARWIDRLCAHSPSPLPPHPAVREVE
jgi:ammonium transporter, Amt family